MSRDRIVNDRIGTYFIRRSTYRTILNTKKNTYNTNNSTGFNVLTIALEVFQFFHMHVFNWNRLWTPLCYLVLYNDLNKLRTWQRTSRTSRERFFISKSIICYLYIFSIDSILNCIQIWLIAYTFFFNIWTWTI